MVPRAPNSFWGIQKRNHQTMWERCEALRPQTPHSPSHRLGQVWDWILAQTEALPMPRDHSWLLHRWLANCILREQVQFWSRIQVSPYWGEALATINGLDKFKSFILGLPNLTFCLDHKPLLGFFGKFKYIETISNLTLLNFMTKNFWIYMI